MLVFFSSSHLAFVISPAVLSSLILPSSSSSCSAENCRRGKIMWRSSRETCCGSRSNSVTAGIGAPFVVAMAALSLMVEQSGVVGGIERVESRLDFASGAESLRVGLAISKSLKVRGSPPLRARGTDLSPAPNLFCRAVSATWLPTFPARPPFEASLSATTGIDSRLRPHFPSRWRLYTGRWHCAHYPFCASPRRHGRPRGLSPYDSRAPWPRHKPHLQRHQQQQQQQQQHRQPAQKRLSFPRLPTAKSPVLRGRNLESARLRSAFIPPQPRSNSAGHTSWHATSPTTSPCISGGNVVATCS